MGIFATDALIVYDSTFQRENDEYIYVYSVLGNRIRRRRKVEVRSQVQTALEKDWGGAIASYSRWLSEGGTYEQVHSASDFARDRPRYLHKKKIEDAGLPYLGVRQTDRRIHRTSHCWDCHNSLDSTVTLECVACKWMLCKCGACGCNYKGEKVGASSLSDVIF